jgi:hypothetical protein
MSDALIGQILTFLASILGVFIIQWGVRWVNKKKVPAEVNQINANTELVKGDIAEKMQKIASATADENIELNNELKTKEAEKKALMKAINELRNEMETMEERHNSELKELEEKQSKEFKRLSDSFEMEKLENQKWKDWANRLTMQLGSWGLTPVPFDVESAKKSGLSLGDIGNCGDPK